MILNKIHISKLEVTVYRDVKIFPEPEIFNAFMDFYHIQQNCSQWPLGVSWLNLGRICKLNVTVHKDYKILYGS